ncbi:substrate-binding domain-containing protein, partial [Telmatospirillum sp.]|uniref:substrate-binding domain-containing protein n=1 Tax=Telmatospirillum sp. TaxID=2079197 RepID=UPI0028412B4F
EQSTVIGQITFNWDTNVARTKAEANLTAVGPEAKGTVFILSPNDTGGRAIADVFAVDKDVKKYYVTGQDAEIASIQYIIDGKQSMTVLKDVRTLVKDAIAAAIDFMNNKTPEKTSEYDNGSIKVPAKPTPIVTVTKENVKAAIVDSGYWPADKFSGL